MKKAAFVDSPGADSRIHLKIGKNYAARKRKKKAAWAKKNGETWGKKTRRGKKVEWYNKNRYGGYGRLIRRLTAGMSEQEQQRIRGILQSAKGKFAVKS